MTDVGLHIKLAISWFVEKKLMEIKRLGGDCYLDQKKVA